VHVAAGEAEGQQPAVAVGEGMDLRGQAAPRAPDRMVVRFLLFGFAAAFLVIR